MVLFSLPITLLDPVSKESQSNALGLCGQGKKGAVDNYLGMGLPHEMKSPYL